ncbi:SIMPL domain-containing protein [Bartonella sp. LJL80]
MIASNFFSRPISSLAIGAAAGMTLLSAQYSAQAGEVEMKHSTIVVSATGETQTAPDMAVINLAVVTNDKTAQQALAANNKAMNDVLESFKKSGIEPRDLQTSGLSIYPVNEDSKEKKVSEQKYRVSNSLTVRIRDLALAGKIFDQAMSLGINSVSGISFTNAEQKPFYTEARKKAVAEAIEKAQTLAGAANVKLGPIISISEENFSSGVMPRLASAAKPAYQADTNFAGGELDYAINVTVTFAIDQ